MAAPSFASFPPSFGSFPDLEPSVEAAKLSEPAQDKKHRSKKDKSDKDKTKSRKRKQGERSPKHGNYTEAADYETKRAQDAKSREESESLRYFYSDRKGDPLNILYDGLHRGDIPKYKIIDHGRKILGLSTSWVAVSRSNHGVEVGIYQRKKMPRLTDAKTGVLLSSTPARRIVDSVDSYKYKETDGFLRLRSGRRRKAGDESYRSITRTENHEANSDTSSSGSESDPDGASSEDDASTPQLSSHQEELRSLEQQLTADPWSISSWISLLSRTLSNIPISSKNATRARSEITVSILSRAFAAHPQNRSSSILWLKYLLAGEAIWHESKLRTEWEAAFKVGGIDIWMEWLEWKIRKGNKGVDGIVESASRVLDFLGMDEEGEVAKLRVFWRVAVAFQQAGFGERATAMFQAQAELTFEVPQALYGLPMSKLLEELADFWESEVPRTGEIDAKGWSAWVSSGRPEHTAATTTATSLTKVANPEQSPSNDPYLRWALQESHSDCVTHLPSRSTDDSDQDPYATILFHEIQPLLLSLHSTAGKNVFRQIWLSVLGLHIPGFSASLKSSSPHGLGQGGTSGDERWAAAHLVSKGYLDAIFPPSNVSTRTITTDAVAGVIVGRERVYGSGFGVVRCWGHGVLEPLDSIFGAEGWWNRVDVDGLDCDLITRVFRQLRLGSEDYEWDMLALAFEAARSVKSALKLSRSFLSVARDSLPHWTAHAALERMRGRHADARKVYQTVLVASTPPSSQPGVSQLWSDWAEMEWLSDNPDAALSVILRAVKVEGREGIQILRAKRSLDELCNGDAHWKERESWIKLRALLDLLTSADPETAIGVFDDYLSQGIEKDSSAHESLTVACLLMLYRHGTVLKNPNKPLLLRERVEQAIELYPSNSIVLGLFLEGEKGQGVWGRVRRTLGEVPGTEKDVYRRVEEVWINANWDTGRWEAEIERTRSGLAAATDNEWTRVSPVLWRMFVEFEIRVGQLTRAKKMLFRAIGEYPLVKEFYLLAFGPLRSAFSAGELNGFADTMAERDLRMRTGLDEMLEGWEESTAQEKNESQSEDSEDEIEENARELRRLRPY